VACAPAGAGPRTTDCGGAPFTHMGAWLPCASPSPHCEDVDGVSWQDDRVTLRVSYKTRNCTATLDLGCYYSYPSYPPNFFISALPSIPCSPQEIMTAVSDLTKATTIPVAKNLCLLLNSRIHSNSVIDCPWAALYQHVTGLRDQMMTNTNQKPVLWCGDTLLDPSEERHGSSFRRVSTIDLIGIPISSSVRLPC
jgi:hypothetical protein